MFIGNRGLLFHVQGGVAVEVAVFLVVLVAIYGDEQHGLFVGVATLVFDFPQCSMQEGDAGAEQEVESQPPVDAEAKGEDPDDSNSCKESNR